MFFHIPPACITGMQKLTFSFFPPRIKPDNLFFFFFFFVKTKLNSPFICLIGDASLFVFVRKGSDERLWPFTSTGTVQGALYQHSGQSRGSCSLNPEKLQVPRVEQLMRISLWPWGPCLLAIPRHPSSAHPQRTYREAWAAPQAPGKPGQC